MAATAAAASVDGRAMVGRRAPSPPPPAGRRSPLAVVVGGAIVLDPLEARAQKSASPLVVQAAIRRSLFLQIFRAPAERPKLSLRSPRDRRSPLCAIDLALQRSHVYSLAPETRQHEPRGAAFVRVAHFSLMTSARIAKKILRLARARSCVRPLAANRRWSAAKEKEKKKHPTVAAARGAARAHTAPTDVCPVDLNSRGDTAARARMSRSVPTTR